MSSPLRRVGNTFKNWFKMLEENVLSEKKETRV